MYLDNIGTQSEGAALSHGRNSNIDPQLLNTGYFSAGQAFSDEFNMQRLDQGNNFEGKRNT